ncbi:flagellar basal body P-ring protein FlgI [Helicobacter mustelae]|uniref:Flagellar P-ring protein n=1 Tax=Helicobacter mustelae (strain ATCC 43772 / CCUG 25715 / CIP 103759 / LMG 18044 / NCTC 12198 / R85-136P) TaxID=679897 RepID=D3UGI4_HELM1|nr:flagellar basal body P-ring protein FlgI [Helicobacter mustelae]CBG39605.1 flagellar P-ring protein [Helicobacter mustelae 12198]SQH71117.1 flagellar P-ring protein [Helicobacter mustelae]
MKNIFAFFVFFACLFGEKIGDIANIVGVRDNQLIGYGLVIGLNGTGDKTSSKFTMQSVANMLESMNIKVSPKDIKSRNVAAVMITATLPPFARQGDKLDIQIASIGDAKSIEGGTLILTPLSAVDGNIYAVAQGNVTLGSSENALSAVISNGATVEKEVAFDIYNKNGLTLSLKQTNFQNAIKVQNILNKTFGKGLAKAIDPRTIKVLKPEGLSSVEFLALVQEINVDYSNRERIIIDEKSGIIVAGVDIIVHPVVVSSGDLTIKVIKDFLNENESEKLDNEALLDKKYNLISSNGKPTTIASVVRALQKMGVKPKRMISILGAMKQSGAISAEIEVL